MRVRIDATGFSFTPPPLVIIMLHHHQSFWRFHKRKFVIGIFISLLLLQYIIITMSPYRILNYNYYFSLPILYSTNSNSSKRTHLIVPTTTQSTLEFAQHISGKRNHTNDYAKLNNLLLNPVLSKSSQNASHLLATSDFLNRSNNRNIESKLIAEATLKFNGVTIKTQNSTFLNQSARNNDSIALNLTINSSLLFTPSIELPICPVLPPVLVGPIKVWFDKPSWQALEELYPNLQLGGHGIPSDCISRHRVAIVIPYRDREEQLRVFLHNMHSLLRKQQLDYTIFVVEQIPNQTFNRAKLMNIGFVEAMKLYDWQCVIFHDVDLLPEDDRNIYSCPDQPRHMSVAVDKFQYRLPYVDIFGGITALTVAQFRRLNGFSNDFWGWGGEDDEIASRVKMAGYKISRYPQNIGRYKMIRHSHESTNPVNKCRYNLMYKVEKRWQREGINSLKFKMLNSERRKLYTWFLVDLLEKESRDALAKERICVSARIR